MAKLTSRAEDYSKWYNELVVKADLAENSGVRGCMVIRPWGYGIWERMQRLLDDKIKASKSEIDDISKSLADADATLPGRGRVADLVAALHADQVL